MLPSTGFFKGINCPFYDSGLCERPYCHFRHVKKDHQNTSNDDLESGVILQKLVSAAVQKVLQQTDGVAASSSTNTEAVDNISDTIKNDSQVQPKVTYNPTPISELNKINNTDTENNEEHNEQRRRHIPVPYTPRKPASLPISRPVEINGACNKPFIYIPPPIKYTPGCGDSVEPDPYLPKGSIQSNSKYLPGKEAELQEYTPKETASQKLNTSNNVNYVPSDKLNSQKRILEYKPTKVSNKTEVPLVTYQPTPRSLVPCFSSDEDEPEIKKKKLPNDLNGLDELGPEFDILDQILDEENPLQEANIKIKKADLDKNNELENCKENNKDIDNNFKKEISSSRTKQSHEKIKLSSKSYDKERKDKQHSSEGKRSHKSSSKDRDKSREHKQEKKEKEKSSKDRSRNEKVSTGKKEYSSSKVSDHKSKQCDKASSKSSDRHSKHSSKSSKDSKLKNKSDSKKSHNSTKPKKKERERRKSSSDDLSKNDINEDGLSDQNDDQNLYGLSESDDPDEDTIALECKRIFEEYVPEVKNNIETENIQKEDIQTDEYIPAKKRISRTIEKNMKIVPKPPPKPDFKVSAAQSMAERLTKVREFHSTRNSLNETSNTKTDLRNVFSAPSNGSSKIRIAHVPYASTLLNAKKTIPPKVNVLHNKASTSTTIAQTIKKGEQRVAHMPSDKFIDRPGVLEPLASKIPANIRSTYLNMMIDECLKIYLLPADAYARAQHEELTTSKKCTSVQIYKNSAVLTVSRLRKELQECNGVKKSATDCSRLREIPQEKSGRVTDSGSWSIENKNKRSDISKELCGARLYNNIKKWVLSEQELQDNGFPRSHPSGEKGRAIIYEQRKQIPRKGCIRTCCRCKKEYTVDKKGFALIKEECIYHPNNKYRVRGEARYQCCSQDGSSDGCCIAPNHVYEYVDYENLRGYIRTLPPHSDKDDYGVYSLDCEMCYTTHGLDLTRITVINSDCKVVYETLIKPLHPIIDYNTRYSGITEDQMMKVKTTLLDVQATLLTMFNSKTILIGHSLESDFKALKLIHDTVIDTSVLFPHKMGPPYKRALRNLCSEHLKKIIQNSVEGHDSAEDATVCMELIHFKLKEDLKTR